MNKMRDFKNIADDIMKDIKVDEDLKKKTLEKSLKKNNMPISKVLIPAACFLLIIIIPTKNSLNPNVAVNESTPLTKNSLSIAINIVAIAKTNIDFLSDHLASPSFSGSDEYISLCV